MTRSTLLLTCLALALLLVGSGCTEPAQGETAQDGADSSEEQASADGPDEEEEPEPEASGDGVLEPAARLAKTRLWQAMIHSPDIDSRLVSGEVDGQTIVLRVVAGEDAAATALRQLAERHLDAEGHAWRLETTDPPGDGASPEEAGDEGPPPDDTRTQRPPPSREHLQQLLTLTGTDDFERDPRLEYDREEPLPAHIVRAATGDRPMTYRVRAGDSLSLIAQRTMGSGNHWQRIHELNRHLIGPDPARLVEGMELRIPQD